MYITKAINLGDELIRRTFTSESDVERIHAEVCEAVINTENLLGTRRVDVITEKIIFDAKVVLKKDVILFNKDI